MTASTRSSARRKVTPSPASTIDTNPALKHSDERVQPNLGRSSLHSYPDISFVFGTLFLGAACVVGHLWFLFYMREEWKEMSLEARENSIVTTDHVKNWIPIFLVTIILEAVYSWWTKAGLYRTNDVVGSMTTSMMMILVKRTLYQMFGVSIYQYVYFNHRLSNFFVEHVELSWWLMLIGVEFCYYWVHRTGHTIQFFWASHSVHHSSEEYNLSTALRQSTIHGLTSHIYYVPMALMGLPPSLFYLHSDFNLLYQFWIHTRIIGKLGPLEWVLNTPSQHRVHHGRNDWCIDTNYGGTLCVFDRMFGTFQEEIEDRPIVYGMTHAINTHDPLEANLLGWRGIWANMQLKSSLKHKFLCLYNGPGLRADKDFKEEWDIPPCTRETIQKYDPRLPAWVNVYLLVHFALSLVMFERALAKAGPSSVFVGALGLFVFMALFAFGFLSDRKPWAVPFELLRLSLGLCFLAYLWFEYSTPTLSTLMSAVGYGGVVVAIMSAGVVITYRHEIHREIDDDEIGKDFEKEAAQHEREVYAASKWRSEKEKKRM
eukprot:TRINITY_DN14716_c0_g1_i1.p1 TRINITY_DN14716_c0_g1~~TRINITY_DN14716_c0_g1_i1.p1  ORF type:complete len:563 (+),score=111.37 TRINITY_DN14716_c0_g1_i1:63-1691(+)